MCGVYAPSMPRQDVQAIPEPIPFAEEVSPPPAPTHQHNNHDDARVREAAGEGGPPPPRALERGKQLLRWIKLFITHNLTYCLGKSSPPGARSSHPLVSSIHLHTPASVCCCCPPLRLLCGQDHVREDLLNGGQRAHRRGQQGGE